MHYLGVAITYENRTVQGLFICCNNTYRETTLKLISDSLEYEMLKRHYRELAEKIFE